MYERISDNGAVITQFPFNRKADKQSFPIRNRIVAGMTLGSGDHYLYFGVSLFVAVARAVRRAPPHLPWFGPKLRRPAGLLRRPARASGPHVRCEHVEGGVRCPRQAHRSASAEWGVEGLGWFGQEQY